MGGIRLPFSPIREVNRILEKQCSYCKLWKPLSEYKKDKHIKSGFIARCKECISKIRKNEDYKIKRRKYDTNKRNENLEKFREKERLNYHRNKGKIKLFPSYKIRYGLRNKDNLKRYLLENKQKINSQRKLRRKNSHEYIKDMVSLRIRKSLKNGKQGRKLNHIFLILGYTIEDLREHLENKFIDGMNWNNYGYYGWHIDHIIPINQFNYNNIDDDSFKKCWSLKNLQPLWMKDNLKKGKKHGWMFAP